MGIIREFKETPGSIKLTTVVLSVIGLCIITVFLLPVIILVIAYPLVLVPIGAIALMALIGAFSIKTPGINDTTKYN